MNSSSSNRCLGEYRLIELRSENPLTRRWLAEQVSVSRRVLVDELCENHPDQRAAFLADIRAKAAVEHPLIGSVYEAVAEPELCFFAHELLPGATLHERRQASAPFKPARLAHLLRRISEAHCYHESLGQATSPLGLEHIHLDHQGVLRLDNLAIAGARSPENATADIIQLGLALRPLVVDGQPGSTRLLTLLDWMSGKGIDEHLTWPQVRDLCEQIEKQLADPQPPVAPTQPAIRSRKKRPLVMMAVLGGVVLIFICVLAFLARTKPSCVQARPRLPDAVLIPAGTHPTPDGTAEELQAFRIAAHEVTIGQYAAFIEILETLAKDHRESTFDHENQAPEKTSHLPDDWPALLAAARSNETWKGRPVTLDSPVVGVDWWDASAYAEWKQARLATQEEWCAALRQNFSTPADLKPADWLPVTSATTDCTPLGLVGMAGSVCEWTRRPATNPTNPMGARKWVIIGGSFLKRGSNALSREWTDDRALRRPDLGFRVVFDAN